MYGTYSVTLVLHGYVEGFYSSRIPLTVLSLPYEGEWPTKNQITLWDSHEGSSHASHADGVANNASSALTITPWLLTYIHNTCVLFFRWLKFISFNVHIWSVGAVDINLVGCVLDRIMYISWPPSLCIWLEWQTIFSVKLVFMRYHFSFLFNVSI